MNITKAKYNNNQAGIQDNISATIDGVAMNVPLDSANRHYQAILEWAKIDGNTIEEAD